MDPNACLYYARQPGVYSVLPPALLTLRLFSADEGGPVEPREIPHLGFQCRSSLTVHQRHAVVIGRRGTLSSGSCLYIRALGPPLTSRGLQRSGGKT
jgi:hypothetical protein